MSEHPTSSGRRHRRLRPSAVKGKAKVRWERKLGDRPAEPRAVWLGLAKPAEQAPSEALWAA